MRRLLIVLSLILLVLASVGVGLLAADLPFWQRAWAWEMTATGWPRQMPGAARELTGLATPLPAPAAGAELRPANLAAVTVLAGQHSTEALLVARQDALILEIYGAGAEAGTLLPGDDLSSAWLAPLYGVAIAGGRLGLLDDPVGRYLPEWQQDARGRITPRQLFWHLSGLEAPAFRPFNPFSDRARLASGPNFVRAALAFQAELPPGGFFRRSAADMQLLALVLQRATDEDLADYLASRLWQPLGAGRARLMLDRRGGSIAAHCCFATSGRDWLRLAMLLANDGVIAGRRILPKGYVAELARPSPVQPGVGLGLLLAHGPQGTPLLVMESDGRWLIAAPGRGIAAVWFAREALPQDSRDALLTALGL